MIPYSFYKANITLIPKPVKDNTRKENYRRISVNKLDAKSSTKYKQTKFNNILKGSYTMIEWDLSQGCKNGSIPTNQSM